MIKAISPHLTVAVGGPRRFNISEKLHECEIVFDGARDSDTFVTRRYAVQSQAWGGMFFRAQAEPILGS
jgi:hypothetical protein